MSLPSDIEDYLIKVDPFVIRRGRNASRRIHFDKDTGELYVKWIWGKYYLIPCTVTVDKLQLKQVVKDVMGQKTYIYLFEPHLTTMSRMRTIPDNKLDVKPEGFGWGNMPVDPNVIGTGWAPSGVDAVPALKKSKWRLRVSSQPKEYTTEMLDVHPDAEEFYAILDGTGTLHTPDHQQHPLPPHTYKKTLHTPTITNTQYNHTTKHKNQTQTTTHPQTETNFYTQLLN